MDYAAWQAELLRRQQEARAQVNQYGRVNRQNSLPAASLGTGINPQRPSQRELPMDASSLLSAASPLESQRLGASLLAASQMSYRPQGGLLPPTAAARTMDPPLPLPAPLQSNMLLPTFANPHPLSPYTQSGLLPMGQNPTHLLSILPHASAAGAPTDQPHLQNSLLPTDRRIMESPHLARLLHAQLPPPPAAAMGLTNSPLNLSRPPASVSRFLPQTTTSITDPSALDQGASLLPPTVAPNVAETQLGQLKRPPPGSPEQNAQSSPSLPSSPKRQRQDEPIKRPIFPVKLMKAMVHHENNQGRLYSLYGQDPPFKWLGDGSSFIVVRQDAFCQFLRDYDLADQYAKYTSFVRKLNRWGFERKRMGLGHSFHHELFRKGRLDLASTMENKQRKAGTDASPGPDASPEPDASPSV